LLVIRSIDDWRLDLDVNLAANLHSQKISGASVHYDPLRRLLVAIHQDIIPVEFCLNVGFGSNLLGT
jgi:hypothetical protein